MRNSVLKIDSPTLFLSLFSHTSVRLFVIAFRAGTQRLYV